MTAPSGSAAVVLLVSWLGMTAGPAFAGAPWFCGPLVGFAYGAVVVLAYPFVLCRFERAQGRAEIERKDARRKAAQRLGLVETEEAQN